MISAHRYHDFSAGHRVVGHESKCQHLHGHNYRVHFECIAEEGTLDSVGRVLDFGAIKQHLCEWLETHWDHKMLIWKKDPMLESLKKLDPHGICVLPFNPTAENMAAYLLHEVGPKALIGTGAILTRVTLEETRKCSATAQL